MASKLKAVKKENREDRADWVGKMVVGSVVLEVKEWVEPIVGTSFHHYVNHPTKVQPISGVIEKVTDKSVCVGGNWYPVGDGCGSLVVHEVFDA